jgi:beta-ureidopropionase / N-carbamoyl-L-amino-acid hydrolase
MDTHPNLRINPHRFRQDFLALAAIGATPAGGVDRPTFSPAHLQARAWFARQVKEAGLELRVDGAGNHSAFLGCAGPGAPVLLLGSHLDSVPNGGRFDGALGVLAALEALRVVKEAGLSLKCSLEAIDFTDEEGTLFGLLGSRLLVGALEPHHLAHPRGGRAAFETGLQRAGLSEAGLLSARRDPAGLAGYLELHIEQSSRLQQAGASIGVVTVIVGIGSYRLTFIGQADHAGTTPLAERRDAGLGAAAFTLAARQLVLDSFPGCVVNVGSQRFHPGSFNIVPGRVELDLEFRAADLDTLHGLEAALLELAAAESARWELGLEALRLGLHPPAEMSPLARQAVFQAAAGLELAAVPLSSGAGHDAQSLAPLCPAGMFFIPSTGGSHSPRELAFWDDCLNGANLLLQAALRLAS